MHGTVPVNGYHLHISVSDIDGTMLSRHVKAGCVVRTTCKLVIGSLDNTSFSRKANIHIDLKELVISLRVTSRGFRPPDLAMFTPVIVAAWY